MTLSLSVASPAGTSGGLSCFGFRANPLLVITGCFGRFDSNFRLALLVGFSNLFSPSFGSARGRFRLRLNFLSKIIDETDFCQLRAVPAAGSCAYNPEITAAAAREFWCDLFH